MIKRVLLAAAMMVASPAIVSAQDVVWSFSPTSLVTSAVAPAGAGSGTAYIFSDGPFGFDAIDLDLITSDPSVLQITGGTVFDSTFNMIGSTRFDVSQLTTDGIGGGRLFALNFAQNGVNPTLGPLFDPDFVANFGASGGALLAQVNYSIVGEGTATLGFALGTNGAFQFPDIDLDPSFGTATLIVLPEPTSIALLLLGSVGLVAPRKRS